MLGFFSWLVVILGVLGAVLNVSAAIRKRNGKRGVRLFAALVCAIAAVIYGMVIVGWLPSPLPSDWGRPLIAAILTALVGFGIVEA